MPFGFLSSAMSAVTSYAGNAMASFVPKITSIITPTIAMPSMSSLGANLMNSAKGMATSFAMGKINGLVNKVTGSVNGFIDRGIQSVVGRIPSGFTRAIDAINILQEGSSRNIGGILGGEYSARGSDHFSKQIKSLVSKSPYNFDALAEKAHMGKENNPFKYTHLHFPQEVSNMGDGHYIIFDVIDHKQHKHEGSTVNHVTAESIRPNVTPTLVGEAKNRATKTEHSRNLYFIDGGSNNADFNYATLDSQNILGNRIVNNMYSGTRSKNNNVATITSTIVLGMPNQNHTFDYKIETTGSDTKMTGNIVNFLKSAFAGDAKLEDLKELGAEGAGRFIRQLIGTISPSAELLTTLSEGYVFNPNMENAFKGVPFRDFTFTFDLLPKNAEEMSMMHNIIKTFKYYMSPKTDANKMYTPSEFQITYAYRENKNNYIPNISRCMLTGCKVDYAPESKFHTFYPDSEGAPPVATTMELTFTELEIMTKETIAQGY